MTVRTDPRLLGRVLRENAAFLLPAGIAAGAIVPALLLGGEAVVAAFLHALALGAAGFLLVGARRSRRSAERMSSDLDAVAHRLLRLETLFVEAQRQDARAARAAADEAAGEIALLGGLVRDLAHTVAAHDRDLAAGRPAAPPADAASPAASPESRPSPPRLVGPAAEPAPPGPVRGSLGPEPSARSAPPRTDGAAAPAPPRPAPAVDADRRRTAAILAALEADRLEMHLQSIVSLPQRKVRAYEALARLRLPDDTLLAPPEFLPLLEEAGLSEELDRRAIAKSAAIAGHLSGRGSDALVTCNLSPRSVASPGFLRSIGRLLDAHPALAGRLVLEVSQGCWRGLDGERAGTLGVLRDRGVPFALDRATDGRLDPLALADRGIRFVKLPADLLLRAGTAVRDIAVADLSAALSRAGISLVAERVERGEDVPDLIDLDVPLAQGFAFAPPRPVRADLGAAAPGGTAPGGPASGGPASGGPAPALVAPGASAAGASAAQPSAAPPEPPPEAPAPPRLPYRAFLRRAG